MKKSQLAEAIKSVLAENRIKQAVREVLAEEILNAPGQKQWDSKFKINYDDLPANVDLKTASLNKLLQGIPYQHVAYPQDSDDGNLLFKTAEDLARAKKALMGKQSTINEEEYDTVKDVTQALNNSRPSQDEVENYLGRSLSKDELRAFGFNSGTVTGYKYGQPQYAGQGQRKTYTSYARGNSRRSY